MTDWRRKAREYAQQEGIDPNLFERQIQQESGFRTGVSSPAGAIGIAQIMPSTAQSWHVDPNDPNAALRAAARHMAQYQRQFGGSYRNALVAYNAGPGRVGHSLPAETQNYIRTIMGGHGDTASSPTPTPTATPNTQLPDNTDSGVAQPNLFQYFASQAQPTNDPLQATLQRGWNLLAQLQGGAPTQAGGGVPNESVPTSSGTPGSPLSRILQEANRIDSAHVPYLWGGGHQAHQVGPGSKVTPLDCSGAVSRALGIDPRVASQFEKWGGAGPGKHVSIYAKDTHVLMEINGHFWGTSGSNPGGGAGWIPRSALPDSYLKQFTVRHPKGM
jgi:hypothetical protein